MTVHAAHSSRHGLCLCAAAADPATGGRATPQEAFAKARLIVATIKSEAARAPITVHRLRGNISVLEGSGANIAVLTGPDGKVLIDAGIAVSRPRIAEALAGLGADPITHLINTHWHFDHADGNEWLHAQGAAILAHENTLTRLAAAQRVEGWSYDFPAAPLGALPTETFTGDKVLHLDRATIALKYYGPAHTDGDIGVTFEEADILHAGDTFWNGIYPFIDYSTGGHIDGTIAAAEANAAAAKDTTIAIPGHGPLGGKAELVEYRDMLTAVRANVAALKRQGASFEAILAVKPTAAFDAKWGNFAIEPGFFTKLVYDGI